MVAPSWNTIRKRLAPLVLLFAVGLLVRETCAGQQRSEITLRFDLGVHGSRVRALWVDVMVDGTSVGQMQRSTAGGVAMGVPEMKAVLPDGQAELRIDLELLAPVPGGSVVPARRVVRRGIRTEGGDVVTVALGPEVAREEPAPPQ